MYEIFSYKTRLFLVLFRSNFQWMLFNLWFEKISDLIDSYGHGTYIYHYFKDSSPKQRNISTQNFGNKKTIIKSAGRKRIEINAYFYITAFKFIKTFLLPILVSRETREKELITRNRWRFKRLQAEYPS